MKLAIVKEDAKYQLVPPHQHKRNTAEKQFGLKNHLLAGITTCDPDFPITEWDGLLRQSEITLNLPCTSSINTKLSAWAYLSSVFDFNKTPSAPPCSERIIHYKPNQRAN